jgi:hypothetical protein
MAHPLKHAESSARRFGGKAEDYLASHNWFDESKFFFTDFRHRALRHHAEGILLCERIFGVAITNSQGKQVPVRYIGEQHVREDLGRIPTAQDWLSQIKPVRWMYGHYAALGIVTTMPSPSLCRANEDSCRSRRETASEDQGPKARVQNKNNGSSA